jgi:ribosomal protein S27E
MSDEISVPVSLPLDSDGFLRRECPHCEQEFKWYSHGEGSAEAEDVDQYFCPRCGEPAGLDQWWTPAQLDYSRAIAMPAMDQMVNDLLDDALKPLRNSKFIKVERTGQYSSDLATPDPLIEPDDMVIVEPPCHPHEPVKVPDAATSRVHCLICGAAFAA